MWRGCRYDRKRKPKHGGIRGIGLYIQLGLAGGIGKGQNERQRSVDSSTINGVYCRHQEGSKQRSVFGEGAAYSKVAQ